MSESLRLLYDREAINQRVTDIAQALRERYRDDNPVILGVLKGSFIFVADLVRRMGIPCEVDFVRLKSYQDTLSTGKVELELDLEILLKGRPVIIVEDICDTGLTLNYLIDHLKGSRPGEICSVVLIDKPHLRHQEVVLDYIGFSLKDEFVVGYGIDRSEAHRELPELYAVEE